METEPQEEPQEETAPEETEPERQDAVVTPEPVSAGVEVPTPGEE